MSDLLSNFWRLLFLRLQEEDKIKHMVWSFWLTILALAVWPPTLAFFAVFLLGLAKEIWDERYGSGFCFFDLTGNFIGSCLALGCGAVLSFLFFNA